MNVKEYISSGIIELYAMNALSPQEKKEVEQMAAALDAGANEYVMKPFTREILVDKLQLVGVQV